MGKEYSTLIVDDERLARTDLKKMLLDYENIRVVGEAEDVPSAIKAIEEHKPDLIFLDIQMPGESGFDLLDRIEFQSKIIFITAYAEYALRAFDVNAMDYLLKPVNPERLKAAIDKLDDQDNSFQVHSAVDRKLDYDDSLFLLLNSSMKFLKVRTIVSICALRDYSEITTTSGRKGLTQKSMKEWEKRLPEHHFCRIHRSTIVNMEYIDRLEEWFNYSFRVYLKGIEEPYIMSRRYVTKLKEKFG